MSNRLDNKTDAQNELIERARSKIAQAKRPVSFSGAGLSTESGIATFRDKNEDGLWSQYDPMKLASQQGFEADPDLVINWYNWRRQTLALAEPNNAHRALAAQPGWIHITQNVDWLLEDGGAIAEKVLHLHGTLAKDHCNALCGYSEDYEMKASSGVRDCPKCGNALRPSVVWFGEALPEDVFSAAIQHTQQADLFLVVGTSAQVAPASGLIDLALENEADIIIVNTEQSVVLEGGEIELIGKAGDLIPKLFEA